MANEYDHAIWHACVRTSQRSYSYPQVLLWRHKSELNVLIVARSINGDPTGHGWLAGTALFRFQTQCYP
jgi:hypothetical protein